MATRKKRAKKIKFELTKSAIGGIGVVCFCVFLWMFLLGVWAGQSLLLPMSQEQRISQQYTEMVEQKIANLEDQKKRKPAP